MFIWVCGIRNGYGISCGGGAINSNYLSFQAFMFSPKMCHLKLTMSSCWTCLTLCFSRCNSSQLMSGLLRFKFIWCSVSRHYIFTKGQYHNRIQLQNVWDSPVQESFFSKEPQRNVWLVHRSPTGFAMPDNILGYHLYTLIGKLQGWTCSI